MGNTVLITGTSSGIGKATALYFAKQGWNVIATMRKPGNEEELTNEPNIFVTKLEVSDIQSVQTAIQQGIEKFGQIDVLVNNAGYGQVGLFEATTPEKIQAQFDTNVFGLMNVTRAVLPHFRNKKSGTIINVSSTLGIIPMPTSSIYTASKFAVEGFSESLAYELHSQNIKVKIIEPGGIDTSFSQRIRTEFAYDPELTDYASFVKEGNKQQYSYENSFTVAQVANVIYRAATDGSNQLRYIAGHDAEHLIGIRNKSTTDAEYVETIRNIFAPNAFKD